MASTYSTLPMEPSLTSGGFSIYRREIEGVLVIEPRVFSDERGYFFESYRESALRAAGVEASFVQDNQSMSRAGALRGLHFQRSRPQGKLIRVLRGAIFDVVADIRRGSATFGRWVGQRLDAESRQQLYMPPGLLHGYLALADDTEIAYKCTDYYVADDEGGVHWQDPSLDIAWPLDEVSDVVVSAKDAALPSFAAVFGEEGGA